MKLIQFATILIDILASALMNQDIVAQSRPSGDKDPLRITLQEKDFDNAFLLSKHVKSLRLIPLETRPDCFINQINQLEFFHDKIFILQKKAETGILVFDRDGKYLHSIGRKGKGPGEYTGILNFSIDPAGRTIYLTDPWQMKIHLFTLSGEYIRSIGQNSLFEGPAVVINENRIAVHGNSSSKGSLSIWDGEGREVKSLFPYDHQKTGTIYRPISQTLEGLAYVRYAVDTIYSINNDKVTPMIVLDLGDHHLTLKEFNTSFPGLPKNKWVLIGNVLIGQKIIKMDILKEKLGHDYYSTIPVLYWVDNQSIETVLDKKSDDIFLMDYLNFTTLSSDDEWATSMQAVDLVEKRAKILENNSPLLGAKNRKAIGLISENDNPVLIVFGLK